MPPLVNKLSAGSRTPVWIAAAGLPLLSHATALLMSGEPAPWLSMGAPVRRGLAADALLLTALSVTIAAPLAGVSAASAVGGRRRAAREVLTTLGGALLMFTAVSALLTWTWMIGQPAASGFIGRFHLTLAAVTLALASWGALCGAWFLDPLDAAACSLLVAVAAAGGVLVGGAAIADLPRPVIAAALNASPVVVLSTAAQIDIVHLDLLYQISPLAHLQIDYPAWQLAGAGYMTMALVCLMALAYMLQSDPASPTT